MVNRDATDTITGYFYQFDKTILEILSQSNLNDAVEVEGVEDIDVHDGNETTAIQCKYYAKTEYNHSVIKHPITLMVKHFSGIDPAENTMRYHLYGHFKSGQDKLGGINVDILKSKFLTYQKSKNDGKGGKIKTEQRVYDELGLDDSSLQIFLDRLSLDINAPSFEDQSLEIVNKLESILKVTAAEAELYHYNSALKVIRDLSVQQDKKARVITKRTFIEKIKAQDEVFDSWYIRRKGRENYIKSIRKQRLSSGLNMDPFNRFFLIDCASSSEIGDIKELVYSIAKKWSKISTRQKPCFCPSIYLHGLGIDDLKNIKKEMYSEGQLFIDGYPFYGADINPSHFYTTPSIDNKIKFRIVNSIDDLRIFLDKASGTLELYEFYNEKRFFEFEGYKYTAIKIEDTSYIKDMMK